MDDRLNEEDWAEISQHVSEIRANTIAKNSQSSYEGSYTQFLAWCLRNKPNVFAEDFLNKLKEGSDAEAPMSLKLIRKTIKTFPNLPPLKFDDLDVETFMSWIVTKKRSDGSFFSFSSYSTHRSALYSLYRQHKVRFSSEFENELKNHFRGLKRKIASEEQAGQGVIKRGKDPLTMPLFKILNLAMLHTEKKDFVFFKTFLTITWNLMCRAVNTFSIHYRHLTWKEDALCIIFCHQKNDQAGEKARDPRHVYANPLQPEICPVLSLGMYWSIFGFGDGTSLFGGNNQYDRFRKGQKRIFSLDEVENELRRRGLTPEEFGTHSLRKGAATFCASGHTNAPPIAAVQLRAGWSMGTVLNVYLRFEAAGDQYVGRTVSGLPISSYKFSTLPPRFTFADDQVERAKQLMFPSAPKQISLILEFCLASMVYHENFLRKELPENHLLFNTPIFQEKSLIQTLRKKVICGVSNSDGSGLQATGIPAHVDILTKLHHVGRVVDELVQRNERSRIEDRSIILTQIKDVLEERDIGSGVITHAVLKKMLDEAFAKHETEFLLERMRTLTGNDGNEEEGVENMVSSNPPSALNLWPDNVLRRVPVGFSFPKGTARSLWLIWNCGNAEKSLPPLKTCTPIDMPNRNCRKKLSDLKFLMNLLENEASKKNLSPSIKSLQDAQFWFDECKKVLEVKKVTPMKRSRRTKELSWQTVVKLKRKELQLTRTENHRL
eukprot:snap_masked-scaffold_74-processed-gene-0.44-mRNA-1 protein AED:0.01 eAED:0.01 QI:0/-1/0/1/-1/1/1/0/718